MDYFTLEEYPKLKFPWYKRPAEYLWRILRQYVYERDEGRCQYCGNPVELMDCHIHHALELSEGGTNHPSNLKTLCKDCHKDRHPFMKTVRDKLRELKI
jgi:5-methylcytosine-specific restriction endonuclease McrA